MGWTALARHRDQLGVRAVAVLAEDVDPVRVRRARVDHDALVGARDHAGAVGAEDPRLRHRGQALPQPDVEMVERGGPQLDEHLAGARHRIRHVLVAEDLGAALLVDPDRLHALDRTRAGSTAGATRRRSRCHNARVTTAEVQRLGLRARPRRRRRRAGRAVRRDRARTSASAARAASSAGCGSRPRSPRSRATPSCCSTGARSVVSAALCYCAPEPELAAGHGRLPRYTWHDGYAELREKLDALGRALGGALPRARRREPARRPRGGGALRRRLLRQEHDADHAPPRLVGRARDARHRGRARADAAAARRLRLVHALHRRLPDRRARRARRRSTRRSASRTGRRCPSRSPRPTAPRSARRSTAATSARTSARGTAASSAGAAARRARRGRARRPRRLARRRRGSLDEDLLAAALRSAQRPALAAAERARRARQRAAGRARRRVDVLERHADGRRRAARRARALGARRGWRRRCS